MEQQQIVMIAVMMSTHLGIYAPLMILACYITPLIYEYWLSRTTSQLASLIIEHRRLIWYQENHHTYMAVCSLLTELNKSSIRDEMVHERNYVSYTFAVRASSRVVWCNNDISYKIVQEKNGTTIKLYSAKMQTLRDFVREATDQYKKLEESSVITNVLTNGILKIKEWIENQLNAVKSCDYIYLLCDVDERYRGR